MVWLAGLVVLVGVRAWKPGFEIHGWLFTAVKIGSRPAPHSKLHGLHGPSWARVHPLFDPQPTTCQRTRSAPASQTAGCPAASPRAAATRGCSSRSTTAGTRENVPARRPCQGPQTYYSQEGLVICLTPRLLGPWDTLLLQSETRAPGSAARPATAMHGASCPAVATTSGAVGREPGERRRRPLSGAPTSLQSTDAIRLPTAGPVFGIWELNARPGPADTHQQFNGTRVQASPHVGWGRCASGSKQNTWVQ
jgi:hypothetical protein